MKRQELETRFWHRVVVMPSGCWEWQGGLFRDGYPAIWIDGRNERGTRVAWRLLTGEWPAEYFDVLHKCDNPKCVRYEHLWLGTRADNCRDMGKKGRAEKGSKKWSAKLTEVDIPWIRRLCLTRTHKHVAKIYGVQRQTIDDIINGRTWRHV